MLRFSIRDLLLVTLVVASGGGWIVERRNLQKEATELWLRIEQTNGELSSREWNLTRLDVERARLEAENAKLRRWLLDRDTERELALHKLMAQP